MIEARPPLDFEDKTIICCDCHKPFLWSHGEQLYYQDRSLSPPRRCPQCRESRRKRIRPNSDLDNVLAKAREEIELYGQTKT